MAADYEHGTPTPTFAEIDRDGALHEAMEGLVGSTRAELLRRTAIGAGGVLAALALPAAAEAAPAKTHHDVAVLQYDLVLEYLQASFYTEAGRFGALQPKTLGWARVVGAHERAHVVAIKGLLGSAIVKSPAFNFRGVTENEQAFTKTAVAFEDLTVALLKHQIPRFDNRAISAAALSLHSVEARHAAWIRRVVNVSPVATAFDEPVTAQRV